MILKSAISLLGMITLSIASGVIAGPVPDTGQTQSYTDTFGEDSDYTINPPSYTKLDAQGNELDDSSTEWVMVRDNVTGLVWEVKTDDGTVHDKDNTYTWQNAQDVFIADLNGQNFGGFSDWRLPTIKELVTILDCDQQSLATKTKYFPNTLLSSYWTSSNYSAFENVAWIVFFYNGYVGGSDKYNKFHVRAIRGGQVPTLDNFINNDDGTITDTETGLMWQSMSATAPDLNWEDSITYCENLTLAGYNDWRLPSRNELYSLVHHGAKEPTIDTQYFPDTLSSYYWSSTSLASNSINAWPVSFLYGGFYKFEKSDAYQVRAVRGGQNRIPGNLFILEPRQASFWKIGDSMSITWNTEGSTGNVMISLSRQGGKDNTYEVIAESTANDGNYEWIVTGSASVNCMLKIKPLGEPDKSTVVGFFSITEPEIPTEVIIGFDYGWNFISLPMKSKDELIEAIFLGVENKVISMWKWENNDWAIYLPGEEDGGAAYAESKGFEIFKDINPGEGFWVNTYESFDLEMETYQVGYEPLLLIPGWNSVGIKGSESQDLGDLISSNESEIDSVWIWRTNNWHVYLPAGGTEEYAASKGFETLDIQTEIKNTEGIWINYKSGGCATWPIAQPQTTGAPGTPGGFTATAGDGKVTLSWNAVSGAHGYYVFWTDCTVAKADDIFGVNWADAGNITTYDVTGLANETAYQFKVSAYSGSFPSQLIGAETSAVDATPTAGVVTTTTTTVPATTTTTSPVATTTTVPAITTTTTGIVTTTTTVLYDYGAVQVIITPQEAIDAGSKWRVDGGSWQNSGDTVSGLPVGYHTVEFKEIEGWIKPTNQLVTINADTTTIKSFAYTEKDDYGDDCESAITISVNTTLNGSIEKEGDYDYFHIITTTSGTLRVFTTGSTDTYGYLKDNNCSEIKSNDNSGSELNFSINHSINAGSFYIAVRHQSPNSTGEYLLHIEFDKSGSSPLSLTWATGILTGLVLDSITSNPKDDVTITVEGIGSCSTLPNGYYFIELPPGKFNVQFQAKGFISYNETIEITGFNSQELNVGIDPGALSFVNPEWNLLSLYIDPFDPSISSIIGGIKDNIESLWKWTNNNWSVYLPGESDGGENYAMSKGFRMLGYLYYGEGFWINSKLKNNQKLIISGNLPEEPPLIFIEHENFHTHGATAWENFTIEGDTYLAVANFNNGSLYNIDSKIYKWNGTSFNEIQSVPTSGAADFESFMIGEKTYLAVANHYNGSTYNIDSKIYIWNGDTLMKGWNLIGLKGDEGKSVTNYISGKEDKITSLWKWVNNKWAVYLPGETDGGAAYAASKGFNLMEVINSGEGFWVNTNQEITLN